MELNNMDVWMQIKHSVRQVYAALAIIKRQMQRIGQGKQPKLNSSPLFSLIAVQVRLKKLAKRYRARYAAGF